MVHRDCSLPSRMPQCRVCHGSRRCAAAANAPCEECHGDGLQMLNPPEQCDICEGCGFISLAVQLNLSIGPGVNNEELVVMQGVCGCAVLVVLWGRLERSAREARPFTCWAGPRICGTKW